MLLGLQNSNSGPPIQANTQRQSLSKQPFLLAQGMHGRADRDQDEGVLLERKSAPLVP